MEKAELERLVAAIEERGRVDATSEYEGVADDGFEIARAMLQVLGRRLGLSFVLETQAEVIERAEMLSRDEDPDRRADAVELAKVVDAGYFTDLIDQLADKIPPGRA